MSVLHARLAAALLTAAFAIHGPAGPRPAFSKDMPTDRASLDAYVRDYLMNNPEVIREALLKLEQDEQIANTKRVLSEHKDELYGAGSPELGNPDATVSIVEFSDYNCPYCRATYPEIKAFLASNPDVKVILKDTASFGKESEAVSHIVIAARKQRNIGDLHDSLMTQKGQVTEARALEIAEKLGFDVERLKEDAATPETAKILERTQALANQLNVNVTPLYIIGHNGIAGAPDDLISQLSEHAETIRKSGCEVC